MEEHEINENHEAGADEQPAPETTPFGDSAGVPWGGILLLIWAVALIIFSVQNADRTTVDFLSWSWDMPVALLVMITALATLVLTGIGAAFYRRKRRKQREMKRRLESTD